MTRTMLAACAIGAFAASTTIAAQTPPAPKPQPSTPPMATQTDKDAVTLTGCLKAWDAGVSGTAAPTPPSPTAAAATKFMLTNVEVGGAAATTPMTTATASPSDAQHYVVLADSGVNLTAHLNHKVRITGTKTKSATASGPDTAAPAEPKPAPSTPSAGRMAGERAHKDLGTITATSVTMISATCPGVTY